MTLHNLSLTIPILFIITDYFGIISSDWKEFKFTVIKLDILSPCYHLNQNKEPMHLQLIDSYSAICLKPRGLLQQGLPWFKCQSACLSILRALQTKCISHYISH